MDEKQGSIEELFTTSAAFDEEGIIRTLKSLVSVQKESLEIFFVDQSLKVEEKVLAFILTRKLLSTKGYGELSRYVSAVEVHKSTGLPKGSIDFAFKSLREDGLLVGKSKTYEIPNYKIPQVLQRLTRHKRS